MGHFTQETRHQLSASDLITLDASEACMIRAEGGRLWVTLGGSSRDIVLEAGESWELSDEAPAFISAFGHATLVVTRPAQAPKARFIWRFRPFPAVYV